MYNQNYRIGTAQQNVPLQQNYRPSMRGAMKDSYNAIDKVNVFSLIKVVGVVILLIVLFVFGKGIVKTVKGWMGFDDSTSIYDMLTGNVKKSPVEIEQQKAELQKEKDKIQASSKPKYSHYIEYVNTKNVKVDPRPIIDEIANSYLTVWDIVPFSKDYDYMNSLSKRNDSEIRLACRYWDEAYGGGAKGQSLYQFLNSGLKAVDHGILLTKLKSLGFVIPIKKHYDKYGKPLKK